MAKFSPELTRLLLIRGIARSMAPIAVLWGIVDWYLFDRAAVPPRFPWHALVFTLLTGNFILLYILVWTAPNLLNGPWRTRPWQTFILLFNFFYLPIQYYRHLGTIPIGFILITILFFVGLYVATAIYFHLQDKLPMAGGFAARRAQAAKPAELTTTTAA